MALLVLVAGDAVAGDPPPRFKACRPLEPVVANTASMTTRAKEAVIREKRYAPSAAWSPMTYRPADCQDYKHEVVCGSVNGDVFVFVVTTSERREQVLMDSTDLRTVTAMVDGLKICAGSPTP